MDNKRLEDKLDKIEEHITEIKQVLTINTSDIAYHIKRSDMADQRMDQQDEKIKPLEKHVSFMKGVCWALGLAGTILIGLNELGLLQKLF